MNLNYFDLLCGEPIYIDGVGHIKSPKLEDIKKINYKTYEALCYYMAIDLSMYLKITGLNEKYGLLSDKDKKANTLYNLIANNQEYIDAYKIIFDFSIVEDVLFDYSDKIFKVYSTEDVNPVVVGYINGSNFDYIRDCLLKLNYLKPIEETVVKYKNERARKIAEKLAKNKAKKANENKDLLNLSKMISKFCTTNKTGINILNVWDMTVYQFYDQFSQYNHVRQADTQDMVYANSVNFSDVKLYDSQLWLK